MTDDRLSFSLELLANADQAPKPLSVCDDGHLVVAGRTHWQPVALDGPLRSLICDWVEHPVTADA